MSEEADNFFKQESEAYNDETLMPFGIHKGKALEDVPDRYFLFLHENGKINDKKLEAYILENLDAIMKNCKR